ncbi:MAG: response regulator transcription factor [Desulfocapsa sp.]|nr:response regulator transcription factor [Desulfocapsa sp.]
MEKTSVVIIDNHPVVRQGLTTALKKEPDLEVVGESEATTSALPIIRYCKPNVAILDGSMTESCGDDLIAKIKTLSKDTSIIIYSMHSKHEPIYRAFKAGAKGYILKVDEMRDVINAITEVQNGRIFLSHKIPTTVTDKLLSGDDSGGVLSSLTTREYEIAKLISQCMTPDEIGTALFISPRTVRVHRSNMIRKLKLKKSNDLFILLRDCFSH